MGCLRVACIAGAFVLQVAFAAEPDAQASPAGGRLLRADPATYLALLPTLKPGDTLLLAPGRYGVDEAGQDTPASPGLPIFGLNGTAAEPITITGPETGPWPVLLGRSTHNTVRFANASHVVLRHLEIDNRGLGGHGVAAQGPSHHITLENLLVRGVSDHQATVAIAANRAPTWGWVLRCNRIEGAGTGMYFGNSDGRHAFVGGLIEHNVVIDTIGYNVQVKHQLPWGVVPEGMPTGATVTVIRHNVFAKRGRTVTDAGARPSLLVGDQPPSGPGAENGFEIYGNVFYQNPTEVLFQGEGRIAFHDNLLVNTEGSGVRIQSHNGVVRAVDVFSNTVVARDDGIVVGGGQPGSAQRVFGNAVFAAMPIVVGGAQAEQRDNVTGSMASAATQLQQPWAPFGQLDLHPKAGRLTGPVLATPGLDAHLDWDRDFNGTPRNWRSRGAYAGQGRNPGWLPALEPKPPAVCRRWDS